jgi:hypothetical protein
MNIVQNDNDRGKSKPIVINTKNYVGLYIYIYIYINVYHAHFASCHAHTVLFWCSMLLTACFFNNKKVCFINFCRIYDMYA